MHLVVICIDSLRQDHVSFYAGADCPVRTPAIDAGEVAYVDHCVGKLIETLRDLGLWDQAVILLLADHGHPLADHGKFLKGTDRLYNELLKVPCMIRLPGGAHGGRRISALAQFHDVLPTLLDALGVRFDPDAFHGVGQPGRLGAQGRRARRRGHGVGRQALLGPRGGPPSGQVLHDLQRPHRAGQPQPGPGLTRHPANQPGIRRRHPASGRWSGLYRKRRRSPMANPIANPGVPDVREALSGRLWEVDLVRGIAVALMVFYHFVWNLAFFGLYEADAAGGAWLIFARSIALVFLLLVGVSLAISGARRPAGEASRRWLSRGIKVLAWGMAVTVVTRLMLGDGFVVFGILHLIGTALIAAPLLMRWPGSHALLAVMLVAAGLASNQLSAPSHWWVPVGITPPGFRTVDYYPILPWLGAVVGGVQLGRSCFPAGRRRWPLPDTPPLFVRPACVAGRHSLLIYLLHQPVLWAGFMLLGFGRGG